MTDDPIFVLERVTYAYPGCLPCLREVSFAIGAGERVALLGANGSGKSTLLRLLDGLYFPDNGTVQAFGTTLTEDALERTAFGPRFRAQVGFLFQNTDAMLFCPTVEEELAFAPLQLRLPADEVRRRVDDTLALMEITDLRDRPPQTLSLGQQKRVGLAAVLTSAPSVLLLDEPTAGLDPRSQSSLLGLLDAVAGSGMTLITATHDLVLLPHLADRCLILSEEGRLTADAPVADVLADASLLRSVNLVHEHPHRHGNVWHSHPHPHVVAHEHEHEVTEQ